ncbi:MAG TPA: hypothetical protein VMT32_11925 [Bryobacteraceae bacterium]|nr:hypothetical protein [Bryobacteraceae bacterium]
MRAILALALLSAACLCGETTVKDKPGDYPVRATAGATSIGAEYLVHSIPAHSQTFFARDYLVVEVAVFPARNQPVELDSNTFTLRLNGKKEILSRDTPGAVAASLKYPDWEPHPHTEVQAGPVILGRPPAAGRFPDDPTQSRPAPPKSPTPNEQAGIDRDEPQTPDEAVAQYALPGGRIEKPVSGYIYFHFRGKTKSIKSVELLYEDKSGSVTLKLL